MYILMITRIISHTYCCANVSSIDPSHTRRTNMTASDSTISPLAFFSKLKKKSIKINPNFNADTMYVFTFSYGVATISRLLQITGFFCRI